MAKASSKNECGSINSWTLTQKEKRTKKRLLNQKVKPAKITKNMKVADLVEQMANMSIQARNIGMCAQVLKNMYRDKKRPTVLLGLAGPLIAAGLREVIKDLIAARAVDAVVSTGAILYQDLYQAKGHGHYIGATDADDTVLNDLKIDRIYDTYVDEEKFWQEDQWCGKMADKMEPGVYSSRAYLDFLASHLKDEHSIMYQCHKHGVPMFAPALNDSSIGIGLTEHHLRSTKNKTPGIAINSIQDNYELVQIIAKSKSTAAIYVAGGVPKNYINDSIVMGYLMGFERGHDYAIQMTTAVTADGGLSSSTLSEARSWGKIKHEANFAMAWVEPSVALPLLASYVIGKDLTRDRKRLKMTWKGQELIKLTTKK